MIDVKDICEQLQTSDRRKKVAILAELRTFCNDKKSPIKKVSDAFDECYLHLLKTYSDTYESVREIAVLTVSDFVGRLPTNEFYLANIVAILAERMGQVETVEPSEEVRLLYIEQLHKLIAESVAIGKIRTLQDSYENIMRILRKALRDKYPAVLREASGCVYKIARNAGTLHFKPWAGQLTLPLYAMLHHKHSPVRTAAVAALGPLALHIDPKGEELSHLIMEVSPLLMDHMPQVRRECGDMGVLLLLELNDRYSYFERIIPLVLCCLKDSAPDVVEYMLPRWKRCGRQFYEENEKELNEQDIGDPQPENYPKDVQRPTIGCRGLVQRSLRLLKLITREVGDWKEEVRIHAMRLLYQFVLHAEAAMTAKFFEIYADVARACADVTPVAQEAYKVADLMGRLFSYEDWYEHGFDGLMRNTKLGYLMCFYHMFNSTDGAKLNDVARVAKVIIDPHLSQTFKPGMQLYVLKMVETLIDKADKMPIKEDEWEPDVLADIKQLDRNMYIAIVKVMALMSDTTGLVNPMAEGILYRVAKRNDMTFGQLHEAYFSYALEFVQNIDAKLDDRSEPIQLLTGLVRICNFRAPYMTTLQDKFKIVFEHCDTDAKLKIFTIISVAMLKWSETMGRPLEESILLLDDFINNVIEPHLEWRAGSNAESLRVMAIATVCSISQGAALEATHCLPKLCKYMPGLLNDRSVAARLYAEKSLFNFGPLGVEELKPIAYATLQRLDDPSSDIRQLVPLAISHLKPKFYAEQIGQGDGMSGTDCERQIWDTFLKKAVDMLFLHYEGPEIRLRTSIMEALKRLVEQYPCVCRERFRDAVAMAYNTGRLFELQLEIPRLA